ncbi:hypothetical protein B0H19DRAFT_1131900 [Mycena capillaripes]|nr:hypothetical protein B0H19DRAFT_1131900 [Mycena capillaripes]
MLLPALTTHSYSPLRIQTPFSSPIHTMDKVDRFASESLGQTLREPAQPATQSRPGHLRIIPIALTRIAPPSPPTVRQVTAKVPSPLSRTTKALPSPLPPSIPEPLKRAASSSSSPAAIMTEPKPSSTPLVPRMSPGAHKLLFNPEAPSAPGSVIYETRRSTLIYETPSAPAPSPVVYYTSGATTTSQTYYVDAVPQRPARQSKIVFHGRSTPPPPVSLHVPFYAPRPYIYNMTPRAW